MGQEWYYSQNGKQYGPVSAAELRQLAAAGKLKSSDHLWKEGMDKWVVARSVKGLFPAAAPAPTPVPPPPKAVPVAADAEKVIPQEEIEEVLEVLPAEEPPQPEAKQAAHPPGLWGFLGKVKETAQKVKENVQAAKESVQKAKEAVRRPTSPTSTPTDTESGLPVLERLGFGGLLAKNPWFCPTCKTKLKSPPPEWGKFALCPNCKAKLRLPMEGKRRDDLIRELAGLLQLDIASPTMQQALAHAVDVIYPTASGGTLNFLQMKVLADQIRQNSVKKALEEGRMDKLIEGQLKVNLEAPLVVAAGTPWKLLRWFMKQFGGYHGNCRLEGEVGHSNPDVNAAYFILQNNLAYEDDPWTEFTDTMLENLLMMAKEHQEKLRQQAELELQKRLLQQQLATQEAQRQAASEQASAARQQQYQQQPRGYQQKPCEHCNQKGGSRSGGLSGQWERCSWCGGKGYILDK